MRLEPSKGGKMFSEKDILKILNDMPESKPIFTPYLVTQSQYEDLCEFFGEEMVKKNYRVVDKGAK